MSSQFDLQRKAAWAKTLDALAGHEALPALAAIGWRLVGEAEEREQILAAFYRRYGGDPVVPAFRRDDTDAVLVLLTPWTASDLRPAIEIHDYAAPGWARIGAWRDVADWIAERLNPPAIPNRRPVAAFDEIIGLIERAYAKREGVFIRNEDVVHWSIDLNLEPADVIDRIAAYLVEGFHTGALDYTYCDTVANAVSESTLDLGGSDSFAWETYLAFDEGEYRHRGETDDPVEKYTRPAVAALFAQLRARDPAS
ncbi:hypothetical protein DMC25_03045 [Caulobacter sp. D4A]|uniref:hypothetical protein n=1 Tax=unclassified Caulobacter TaxID=2648921 RepID=UPI000D72D5B6|nr:MULTISPECIES: hypothetical protein [unclassified Caulobacter]PXA93822.1 hypothetical protein DMC25_03045 [Caulobacter sp. D4A]PXA96291.1 hypothetical protein DMC18_01880 [Caulobacter sp. D5]